MKKIFLSLILLFGVLISNAQVHKIYPNQTDPNINQFTSTQHFCYPPLGTQVKNKLVIYFPGSGAQPSGCQYWMQTCQGQGFHVIGLEYFNSSVDTQFDTISGAEWINKYAYEILFGVDSFPGVQVNYSNCTQNRIVKCLQFLNTTYPNEGWGQYLNGDSIIWSNLIISAH